ncbi:MAG: hypothetical protein ACXVX5_02790, partial [Mycobacterium sp.]
NRKRRGQHGGRPPAFDAADYKGRNIIERGFNNTKQWRGLATRYDKLALRQCQSDRWSSRVRNLR